MIPAPSASMAPAAAPIPASPAIAPTTAPVAARPGGLAGVLGNLLGPVAAGLVIVRHLDAGVDVPFCSRRAHLFQILIGVEDRGLDPQAVTSRLTASNSEQDARVRMVFLHGWNMPEV